MTSRILLSLLAFLALFLVGASAVPEPRKGDFFLGVPISNPDAKDLVPNRYIVVYNSSFDAAAIAAHQNSVIKTVRKRNLGRRSPVSGRLLSADVQTLAVGAWRALVLEADDRMMNDIATADAVSYIEQDARVGIDARQTEGRAPTPSAPPATSSTAPPAGASPCTWSTRASASRTRTFRAGPSLVPIL